MSLNFSIANVVYVKNLSADATENDVRHKFEECDEIVGITFKNFPGKNQKYCQIEFKTSEGITKASRLNGESLLNVPMVVTVIEPVLQNPNVTQMKSGNEQNRGSNEKHKNKNICETPSNVSNALNVQSTSNMNPTTLTADEHSSKGVSAVQNNANTKSNRLDEFSRIVYLENIPENFNASHIDVLFKDVGKIMNRRIQFDEKKEALTAFVEFETEEEAKNALNLNGLRVGGNEILIKDAFSLMNGNGVLKTNFPFFSNKDENIFTYKPTVSEKVEKVLALKEKLTAKLCAMYKPNLLLMNNLIGHNQNTLLTSISATGQNQNTSTSLMNASAIVNAIVKVKEEREREREKGTVTVTGTGTGTGVGTGGGTCTGKEKENVLQVATNVAKADAENVLKNKNETEQDKNKDKVKDKSNRKKHSRDRHDESESDTSYFSSSSADKYRKKKHKERKSKAERRSRSRKNFSRKKKSRRHSKNYSYGSSSNSSNISSSSISVSNSISSSSSTNSSYISEKRRGRSNKRSRHDSRDRYTFERKKRKRGNEYKRFRSDSSHSSSSSGYNSYTDDSSGISRRSERRKSKSIESKSETPWWVRESQKMEMRQRMKEKRLRAGRDFKRSDFWGRHKYGKRR